MSNDQQIIEYINKEFIINNTLCSAKVRYLNESSEELKYIKHRTSYLNSNCKFTERLFHILHKITELPKCSCGNFVKFKSLNSGYYKFCSNASCARKSTKWKNSSITKIENNIKQLDVFKNFLNTNNDYISIDKIHSYINDILIKTDNGRISKLLSSKQYINDRHILASIINRTEHLLKLNLDNVFKFSDFNFSERFYIIINKLDNVPKCQSCGNNRKYISIIDGYARACSNDCRISNNLNTIFNNIENQGFEILENNIKSIGEKCIKVKCGKCGKISEREMFNARWKNVYCSGCYGSVGVSKEETDVLDFIKQLSTNVIQSYKIENSKKEIDIYDSSNNFGIEYNGVFWHSTNKKENIKEFRQKHLIKTEQCLSKNITLLHIFSNEWKNDRTNDIWKSIISGKYNKNERIFARKCMIKETSFDDCVQFLNENHLQGDDKSSIRYGLYYKDILVSVMTFCKSRFDKSYEWELSRFCNKKYTSVVGGASKLLNHFIKNNNPKSLVTYANRRYSNGNLYEKLKFKKIQHTSPNYFYLKSGEVLLSRNSFQKHLLKQKLNNYDDSKTEFENMFNNGFRIIFDCGNIKYGLDFNKKPAD